MKDTHTERGPGGDRLTQALQLVSRDDAETAVPAHVEASVMRAWDAQPGPRVTDTRRPADRPLWLAGVAASAMLAAAVWVWHGGGVRDEASTDTAYQQSSTRDGFAPYPVELLATVDVALDEDPASLQFVQLSIDPSALAAFGFLIADPAGHEPLEIEALVGLDGVPRAIRHAVSFRSDP